ncbi:3D domain-containing protein [Peptococcaceae bacterium 1198_IL3148]
MIVLALALLLLLNFFGKQVTIVVDNDTYEVYTFKATIAQVMAEQNITLDANDIVVPQLQAAIKDGQTIKVVKVDKKQMTIQQQVPFEVVRQADDRLPQGVEKIRQQGSNGIKQMVYSVVLHNGIEVSRDLIKTEVIKEPQSKIVAVGKRPVVPVVSRSAVNRSMAEGRLTAVATAYTFTGHNTATGIIPQHGVVAVDPEVIPLGTRLYVEGYGEAVALDVGGDIKGNRIDVFFPSNQEAINWGRRTVNVDILGK